MPRIAYVNGRYVPFAQASVHVEDRGYQFADGVYEVIPVAEGRLLDAAGHLRRLARSLHELQIRAPLGEAALGVVIAEVITRNRVREGVVYLQASRGVARRDHVFPAPEVAPALVVTAKAIDPARFDRLRAHGIAVITQPDIRWGRCDIKSVALLPNVLARQAAREVGAYEAWLVDGQGNVTEGAATSAWIVTGAGEIVTRPLAHDILPGVTRETLIAAARERQMRVVERPFSVAEAKGAREAFLTAATAGLLPVVSIDGSPVGDGRPGPVSAALFALYRAVAINASRTP